MIKAIYFDLFFTLIIPAYDKEYNEFDIVNLSLHEWEKYAEDDVLYRERALGSVKSEMEIIEKIAANIPFGISDVRVRRSKNIKIGLISNVGLLKPDERIYELAMQHLNVLPKECLYVGDGGSQELYGAKSVGMKTVFTEALEMKSDEKRSSIMENADYHIEDFKEILNYV